MDNRIIDLDLDNLKLPEFFKKNNINNLTLCVGDGEHTLFELEGLEGTGSDIPITDIEWFATKKIRKMEKINSKIFMVCKNYSPDALLKNIEYLKENPSLEVILLIYDYNSSKYKENLCLLFENSIDNIFEDYACYGKKLNLKILDCILKINGIYKMHRNKYSVDEFIKNLPYFQNYHGKFKIDLDNLEIKKLQESKIRDDLSIEDLKSKYLKYKNKYLEMKEILGGSSSSTSPQIIFFDFTNIISPSITEQLQRISSEFSGVEYKTTKDGGSALKVTIFTSPLFLRISSLLDETISIEKTKRKSKTIEYQEKDLDKTYFTFNNISDNKKGLKSEEYVIYKFYKKENSVTRLLKSSTPNIKTRLETELKAAGIIDLKDKSSPPQGILYKCDYDFTKVDYRDSTGRLVPISTIFDSGNSSVTLIDSASVDLLGLQRIPVMINTPNILAFNNLMRQLRLFDKVIVSKNASDPDDFEELSIDNFMTIINGISHTIREKLKIEEKEDNEDLLRLFGIKGTRGIGGASKMVMNKVLLAFKIDGFPGIYYLEADINDGINGILFSKHDMALLERRSLSFGYNPEFERLHEQLQRLIDRYSENEATYDYEISIGGNSISLRYGFEMERRIILGEITRLKEGTYAPIIDVYKTLPPCISEFKLGRSDSGGHTNVEIVNTSSETADIAFGQIFDALIREPTLYKKLELISKIKKIGFTEEQLARLLSIL